MRRFNAVGIDLVVYIKKGELIISVGGDSVEKKKSEEEYVEDIERTPVSPISSPRYGKKK